MMVVVVAGVCAFVVCEKAKRANPQATHSRERKAPGKKNDSRLPGGMNVIVCFENLVARHSPFWNLSILEKSISS